MFLQLDLSGVDVYFGIEGYEAPAPDNWHDQWCTCELNCSFGPVMHYQHDHGSALLSTEIAHLRDRLSALLNGLIDQPELLEFVEPDFVFLLHPDTTAQPAQLQPAGPDGLYVEWRVHFWYGHITSNHLSLILRKKEIKQLRDYLEELTNGVFLSSEQE